jgi:hypothetical protein
MDKKTDTQTYRLSETDIQIKQTYLQTERQTNTQTDRQKINI